MKTFLLSLLFAGLSIPDVAAATIQNVDGEEHAVTVTESGVRSEKTIASNATLTFCSKGCFVVFPNGDMLPLVGTEKVVIESGRGRVLRK